jgi:hypothetical protein
MFAMVPFWALATGLTFPSLASLVSRETDPESQGAMLGGSAGGGRDGSGAGARVGGAHLRAGGDR